MKESIHKPILRSIEFDKRSTSNPREIRRISSSVIIVIDTWEVIDEVWRINGVVTKDVGYRWITRCEEGKNFAIEKILDSDGKFVAFYCDITSPIKIISEGFEYYDWYLDVFQSGTEKAIILDEDEFDLAVVSGYLNQKEANLARETAMRLVSTFEKGEFNDDDSKSILEW